MKKVLIYILLFNLINNLYSQEWITPGDDTLWISTTGGNPIVRGFYNADSLMFMGGGDLCILEVHQSQELANGTIKIGKH